MESCCSSSFLRRPQPVEEQRESTEEPESERTLEEVLYGEESEMAISAIRGEWQSINEVKNWEQIALNTQRQVNFLLPFIFLSLISPTFRVLSP